MDRPIELVPLVCIQCSAAIPAGIEEVAWACAQCGQGMALDEARGLESLEIHYSADIPPDTRGKPYWVADGQREHGAPDLRLIRQTCESRRTVLVSAAPVHRARFPGAA